jgi:hypothetical protein
MEISTMSVTEYVKYRKSKKNKITTQAITKAIRLNHRTPGIIKTEMYGGTYVLYVNKVELDNYLVAIKKPIKLQTK